MIEAATAGERPGNSKTNKADDMKTPKWTQDEAVAFECARECITDLMGICSTAIADEESAPVPNAARVLRLEENLAALARDRAALTVADQDRIAAIRREFGGQVRAHRAQHQTQAA